MSHASGPPAHVLLLGFAGSGVGLAMRLRQVGHGVTSAENLEQALAVVGRPEPPIGAVLIPVAAPLPDLPMSLRYLSEVSPLGELRFIAMGRRPEVTQIETLRAAGVRLALFEPFTEGELRFIVNHAVYNPRKGERRVQTRVPTRIVARLTTAATDKEALVYSLSSDGAYLQTDTPIQPGTDVAVELALPSGTVLVEARVLSCNVGTSYKRTVPPGMGIRFGPLEPQALEALETFIAERARCFQL